MTAEIDQDATLADALIAFIVEEVALDEAPIDRDTDLVTTGLVDSLGVVLVVEWIEARLGVTIDPADVVLEHFCSVAAMLAFLDGPTADDDGTRRGAR